MESKAEQSEKGKSAASFQKDPSVRKRVLELIKRKAPDTNKSEAGSQDKRICNANTALNKNGLETEIVNTPGKSLTAQCSLCGLMYSSVTLLQLHFRRVHLKEKNFKCSVCEFQAFRKEEVQLHELRVHSNSRPVQCSFCSYTTTDIYSLDSHLITHKKVKNFKCDLCPYMCGWKHQLTRHAQSHLSPEREVCEVCGIVSKNKKQDLVHFSLHHADLKSQRHKQKQTIPSSNTKTKSFPTRLRSLLLSGTPDNKSQQQPEVAKMLTGASTVVSSESHSNVTPALPMQESHQEKTAIIPTDPLPQTIPQSVESSISSEQVSDHIQMLNASELIRFKYENVPNFAPKEGPLEECDSTLISAPDSELPTLRHEIQSSSGSDVSSPEVQAKNSPDLGLTAYDVSDINDDEPTTGNSNHASTTLQSDISRQLYETIKSKLNEMNVKISLCGVSEDEVSTGDDNNTHHSSLNNSEHLTLPNAIDMFSSTSVPSEVDAKNNNCVMENNTQGPIACSEEFDKILANLDKELQGYIERAERASALRKQTNEPNNVVKIDAADLNEIVSLIENKMSADNGANVHVSPAVEPVVLNVDELSSNSPPSTSSGHVNETVASDFGTKILSLAHENNVSSQLQHAGFSQGRNTNMSPMQNNTNTPQNDTNTTYEHCNGSIVQSSSCVITSTLESNTNTSHFQNAVTSQVHNVGVSQYHNNDMTSQVKLVLNSAQQNTTVLSLNGCIEQSNLPSSTIQANPTIASVELTVLDQILTNLLRNTGNENRSSNTGKAKLQKFSPELMRLIEGNQNDHLVSK